MISEKELAGAMKECLEEPITYQSCSKLATFCTIYDHFYRKENFSAELVTQEIVGDYGNSDFLSGIRGMDAAEAWAVMDELMEALQVVNPRLYDGVMRKLK